MKPDMHIKINRMPNEAREAEDDLLLKLVSGVHQETIRVTNLCAEAKEKSAFFDGYAMGIQEGRRRELSRVQLSLGITNDSRSETEASEAFDAWKEFKRGPL